MEIQTTKTQLQYLGKNIPVSIDDDFDSVDSDGYLIEFRLNDVKPQSPLQEKMTKNGYWATHDDVSISINISDSSLKVANESTPGFIKKINYTAKTYMNMVFDKITPIDTLIVYISGSDTFIEPVLDYIVSGLADIGGLRIHVDTKDDSHRMLRIKDTIENSSIIAINEAMMKLYGRLFI